MKFSETAGDALPHWKRISTGGTRTLGAAVLASVIAVLALFIFSYFYLADAFKPVPRVDILAANTFDETIRVVTDIDYAPFSYVDENGDYAGLDVELMNEIANRLGVNLDFVLTDWANANAQVLSGEADLIMNMETDLIVEDGPLIATIPTAEKQYVVYGKEPVASVAELYGKRVASLHRMDQLGLGDDVTYLNSYAEIFAALKDGDFDFAICPIQVGNSFLTYYNMDDFRPSYAVSHVYGALACRPENAALRDRINPVIEELQREGVLAALDSKWVDHRYESMSLRGMIENHPLLGALLLIVPVVLALLLIYIVRQRRSARIIAEAKERAEAGSRAKTAFLFNMSHDIRTPMNAIIGFTRLAKENPGDTERVRAYLNRIDASSEQLMSLLDDILEMSRIESGKLALSVSGTDLVASFEETCAIFAKQMGDKGIVYRADASGVRDRYVLCDKNRLGRITMNLISNAWKFTPEGGHVTATLTQMEDSADGRHRYALRVKDDGIGMTEEFSSRVFDAFERERSSTVSGIQGTGLGMAITKSFVDMMGGTIDLVTAPGKGTEFIIRLAFSPCDPPAEATKTAVSGATRDFTGRRLLLVEDIAVNRELAARILKKSGFAVETAENGREAVDRVTASKPGDFDLVLMDIQMPVMDGYAATAAIRALPDPALAGIPVIAMTANAFKEDVDAAAAAGMDGHIAKPLDPVKMLDTIARALPGN